MSTLGNTLIFCGILSLLSDPSGSNSTEISEETMISNRSVTDYSITDLKVNDNIDKSLTDLVIEDITLGEFPYLGAVVVPTADNNALCGACIISTDRIFVSALCLKKYNEHGFMEPDWYTALAGETNLALETWIQWRTVASLDFNHENASESNFVIMRVSSPFWLNWRVQPIDMSISIFKGLDYCITIGWGSPKDNRPVFQVARKLSIVVMDEDTLKLSYVYKSRPIALFAHTKNVKDVSYVLASNSDVNIQYEENNFDFVICGSVLSGVRIGGNEKHMILADLGSFSEWVNYIRKIIIVSESKPDVLPSSNQIALFCNLFLSLTMWTIGVMYIIN